MFKIYRIMPGDSIESIARNLGINIDELKRINGIVGNPLLIPGTNLIIPDREETTYTNYKVKKGDTIYDIARKNNIDYRILLLINGLEENDYIYADEELLIPNKDISLYITKEGDSLNSISKNLSVSLDDIIKMNDILFLSPDQVVIYKRNNFED